MGMTEAKHFNVIPQTHATYYFIMIKPLGYAGTSNFVMYLGLNTRLRQTTTVMEIVSAILFPANADYFYAPFRNRMIHRSARYFKPQTHNLHHYY